jgi:cobalamin biosynthesis Mg chelatase CobN
MEEEFLNLLEFQIGDAGSATCKQLGMWFNHKSEKFGYMLQAKEHKHWDTIFAYINSVVRLYKTLYDKKVSESDREQDRQILLKQVAVLLRNCNQLWNLQDMAVLKAKVCEKAEADLKKSSEVLDAAPSESNGTDEPLKSLQKYRQTGGKTRRTSKKSSKKTSKKSGSKKMTKKMSKKSGSKKTNW